MCDDFLQGCAESWRFIGECLRACCRCFADCCRFFYVVCRDCCTACCTACCGCLKSCLLETGRCCGNCCISTYHCIRDSTITRWCRRGCIGCKNFCVDCCYQCQDCCENCCDTYCKTCDTIWRQCCSGCIQCLKECCQGCATKCVAGCAACGACCLVCLRCGYVRPCCEKCCNYNTYYCNKCELCIRRCCFKTKRCCVERTVVETCCCGAVTDLNLAILLISLIAILTNPMLSWASVRHAYIIKIAPIISWTNNDLDIYDFSLNNMLVFGFGSTAGLAASCLSGSNAKGDAGNTQKLGILNDVITYMGLAIVIVDIIFLICSLALFIRVIKRTFYGAAIAFTVFGILSLLLTLVYSSIYVKSCMMLGKSFPLGQFVFLLLDFFVWAYFLIVVISYLRLHNRDDFEDPYRNYASQDPDINYRVKQIHQKPPVAKVIDKQPTTSKYPDNLQAADENPNKKKQKSSKQVNEKQPRISTAAGPSTPLPEPNSTSTGDEIRDIMKPADKKCG